MVETPGEEQWFWRWAQSWQQPSTRSVDPLGISTSWAASIVGCRSIRGRSLRRRVERRVSSRGSRIILRHDPFGLVQSLNLSRRHLTLAQKKELAKHIFEREPGRTDNSIAKEIGLSHHSVARRGDRIADTEVVRFGLAAIGQPAPERRHRSVKI